MDSLLLQVLNMSITASYVIIFVILARLLLRSAPKVFSYALWSVVFFRLISPFTFESIFSLIPTNAKVVPVDIMYSQTPQVNTGSTVIDQRVNNFLPMPEVGSSANPLQIWISLAEIVWVIVILAILSYCAYTAIRLYFKLKSAKLIYDNIYEIDIIKMPFIFGIIEPKIYLPKGLSEKEKSYIIKHEQNHIKRLDHIIKPISFIIVSFHWFNPLVWVAFYLMSEDMEMSCDESVIKQMGYEIKKDYSASLLSLSTGKRIASGCPLAFSENGTKGRIVNILNYKKPAFWVVIVVVIIVAAIIFGLMSNPQEKQLSIEDYANKFIEKTIEEYNTEENYFEIIDKKITKLEKIASFDELLPDATLEIWSLEYRLKPEDMSKIQLAGGMNAVDGWITEEASMGKPILVFSYKNSTLQFLGTLWSGEADLSMPAGQETALRIFLESRGLLPRETYSGNHVVVKFPLSTGEASQLFLSQPVIQGDEGIWCVERWMDGNGNIYYVTPKTDVLASEYYEALQGEAREEGQAWLKDPVAVAIRFIKEDLGQWQVSGDDLVPQYSAGVDDFMRTPESHYIGFISNFQIDEYSRPSFHLDRIEWLTLEDTERLEDLNIDPDEDMPNGFYIYNPHSYPDFFQVAEDVQYNIIDWGESISHKSVSIEEFKEHLEHYYSGFVPPFRVVTKDGYVRSITEQYVP